MIAKNDPTTAERYEATKREIDARFPPGRFVAVEGGQIIADAETHRKLVEELRVQGKNPQGMLVIQAGIHYPESAVIFGKFRVE